MRKIIQKRKNKFILHLSPKIYPRRVIEKAVNEFSDSVFWMGNDIEIETDDLEDVLEWFNYLIYGERKNI